ncbi:Rossmann-fold NAD(P)-binding domain-containing protein [Jatrophihabitans fulvus]
MTGAGTPSGTQRRDGLRVLVAGASGFVGRALVPALQQDGHEVLALTRRVGAYTGRGVPVGGDVTDTAATTRALQGCSLAYYLVHSLDRRDFARRDAAAAESFGAAARRAGVRRIVYLGGLGDDADDLSRHLRSRREVEGMLAAGGVPVTTLRAGIVIGRGGASWEMIRAMTQRVPAVVVPRWALTRTQPISLADTVRYLLGVGIGVRPDLDDGDGEGDDAENEGADDDTRARRLADVLDDTAIHTYEIGGRDVMRYVDMLSRATAVMGRLGLVVPVPLPARLPTTWLATRLAARAVPLLADVDSTTVASLLESMRNEVVVRDDAIRRVVRFEPMTYDDAVRDALAPPPATPDPTVP